MRLKLDVFEKLVFLTVTHEVSDRGVAVLSAGMRRLVQPGVEWILVDIRAASLSPTAVEAAISLKRESLGDCHPSLKKLVFIGGPSLISDFDTPEQAIEGKLGEEGALYLEKFRLQREINLLRSRKEELSTSGALDALQENTCMKHMTALLEAEVKKAAAKLERASAAAPVVLSPEEQNRSDELKRAVTLELQKRGIFAVGGAS